MRSYGFPIWFLWDILYRKIILSALLYMSNQTRDQYYEDAPHEDEAATKPKKKRKPLTDAQRANLEKGRKIRHELMKSKNEVTIPDSDSETDDDSENELVITKKPKKKAPEKKKKGGKNKEESTEYDTRLDRMESIMEQLAKAQRTVSSKPKRKTIVNVNAHPAPAQSGGKAEEARQNGLRKLGKSVINI